MQVPGSIQPSGKIITDAEAVEETGPESSRATIITARGTGEGLVLRLDGRAERSTLRGALREFLTSRRRFLAGNDVALEWIVQKPEESFVQELTQELLADFDIRVRASRLREQHRVAPAGELISELGIVNTPEYRVPAAPKERVSLFDGMEAITAVEEKAGVVVEKNGAEVEGILWDDPDARVIYSTLRSGQRIESEHTLVIFGDVNSGAEIIAGGDIVVIGTLRGIAHAGAYDESGGGRFIFALNLQPTQLRIGTVITRGGEDFSKGPEVARVDGQNIVVEPYQPRSISQKGPRAAPSR